MNIGLLFRKYLITMSLCVGLIGVAILPAATAFADVQSDEKAFVLRINDDIKAGTALEVQRAITRAEKQNAHLIIELNTPGGLLNSTEKMVGNILTSDADITIYVYQDGGWAFSAGTILLMAARNAYVHPSASIGAAQPFSPEGSNEIQDEKAQKATATWIRNLAESNSRSPDVAERFVSENLTLSGSEALELGVIDGVAETTEEVLSALGLEHAEIEELQPGFVSRVFNVLSHPYFVSLFLALGGLALVLAIRSGEFEFSTAIGLVFMLVGLWGIGIIEFSFLGIGLIVLGLALLLLEMIEPGFGIFGVGGLIVLFFGFSALNDEPFFTPRLTDPTSISALMTLVLGVVGMMMLSRALHRTMRQKSVTGTDALIDQEAIVTKPIETDGRIRLNGESWKAKSTGKAKIPKNAKVRIIKAEGNTLFVKRINKEK